MLELLEGWGGVGLGKCFARGEGAVQGLTNIDTLTTPYLPRGCAFSGVDKGLTGIDKGCPGGRMGDGETGGRGRMFVRGRV